MEEELQLDVAAEVVEMEGVEARLFFWVVVEHARLSQHLHARIGRTSGMSKHERV